MSTIPPLPVEVRCRPWDEIELVHGITSFYPWDAIALLREVHEVLRPSGIVVLEQPNLAFVIDAVAKGAAPLTWLFGDPSLEQPAHMNKWAYTPDQLGALLRAIGFNRIAYKPAQHHDLLRDFRVEAVK